MSPTSARLVVGVAVRFGDEVLLARHRYHADKRFALIAGFVENGEAIEEAAKREVMEEAGLNVRVGTTVGAFNVTSTEDGPIHFVVVEALADSSHVTCNDELEEAVWFHRLNLPRLPPVVSIALKALMTRSVSDVT
jgi:NAD+ diphosphatase